MGRKKRQGQLRPASADTGALSVRRGLKIKIGVEGAIKDTFEIGDVPAIATATITSEDIRRHIAAAEAERKKLN